MENFNHIDGDKKCKCAGCKEDRANKKAVELTGSRKNSDGTTTATFSDGKSYTTRKSFSWDD